MEKSKDTAKCMLKTSSTSLPLSVSPIIIYLDNVCVCVCVYVYVILKGTVEEAPFQCDSFTSFVSFVEFNLILVAVDNRSGIRPVCMCRPIWPVFCH